MAAQEAMPLIEHLYELRQRLVKSAIAIALAMVPVFYFYQRIFEFLIHPFEVAAGELSQKVSLVLPGVADPFTLQIQIVTLTAALAASPVWLYQLWRFVTPGLHSNEKRWGYFFVLTATPLVVAGAGLAYWAMPIGLEVLLGFTPSNVANLIAVDRYFDFFFRMVLAFVIGFLSPLLVVLLNFANILRASTIRNWWRGIVMVDLLFAAIATPTGDPVNMLLVALPILFLLFLAWSVAAINDRRRQKAGTLEADPDER